MHTGSDYMERLRVFERLATIYIVILGTRSTRITAGQFRAFSRYGGFGVLVVVVVSNLTIMCTRKHINVCEKK